MYEHTVYMATYEGVYINMLKKPSAIFSPTKRSLPECYTLKTDLSVDSTEFV